MEMDDKMTPEMEPKWCLGRSLGKFCDFGLSFKGVVFLMRFSIAKKSAQNRKNLQSWRPMANRTGFLERPGGMSGGTGEGTMGRGQRSLHEFCMQCEAEFCRMLTCVRHALFLA